MTEMERMQEEAANSARAMYRRRTPMRTVTVPPAEAPAAEPPPKPAEPPKLPMPKHDLLESLFEDKERALIILLIILLSEDGADSGVIMALMYCII